MEKSSDNQEVKIKPILCKQGKAIVITGPCTLWVKDGMRRFEAMVATTGQIRTTAEPIKQ